MLFVNGKRRVRKLFARTEDSIVWNGKVEGKARSQRARTPPGWPPPIPAGNVSERIGPIQARDPLRRARPQADRGDRGRAVRAARLVRCTPRALVARRPERPRASRHPAVARAAPEGPFHADRLGQRARDPGRGLRAWSRRAERTGPPRRPAGVRGPRVAARGDETRAPAREDSSPGSSGWPGCASTSRRTGGPERWPRPARSGSCSRRRAARSCCAGPGCSRSRRSPASPSASRSTSARGREPAPAPLRGRGVARRRARLAAPPRRRPRAASSARSRSRSPPSSRGPGSRSSGRTTCARARSSSPRSCFPSACWRSALRACP